MATKAKDEFQKVLEKNPNDVTALASLASLALQPGVLASARSEAGEVDEAAKWYKQADRSRSEEQGSVL